MVKKATTTKVAAKPKLKVVVAKEPMVTKAKYDADIEVLQDSILNYDTLLRARTQQAMDDIAEFNKLVGKGQENYDDLKRKYFWTKLSLVFMTLAVLVSVIGG